LQTKSGRLRLLRRIMGYTQAEMAARLGCSLRAYSDNENIKARTVHVMAAEHIITHEAWSRGDPDMLPDDLRVIYDHLVALGYFVPAEAALFEPPGTGRDGPGDGT